jgi:hypothetical protein
MDDAEPVPGKWMGDMAIPKGGYVPRSIAHFRLKIALRG